MSTAIYVPTLFLGIKMIRNIIKATLVFVIVVSTSSIAQEAMALDLDLKNISSADPYYPYVWTPGAMQPRPTDTLNTSSNSHKFDPYPSSDFKKKFSWEIYSGDGLDNLRNSRSRHNRILLPEQDEDTYGISIKQWF